MSFCVDHDWGLGWMHKKKHCEFIKRLSIQKKNLSSLMSLTVRSEAVNGFENNQQLISGYDKKLYLKILGNQRYPIYEDILNMSSQVIRKIKSTNCAKKNWTAEENIILLWMIRFFQKIFLKQICTFNLDDWDQISSYVPGRTGRQCMFRYLKLKKITLAKNPWNEKQEQILVQLLNQQCEIDWNLISEELFLKCKGDCVYRLPKQCRQYWSSYINRQHKKGVWSQEQDVLLLTGMLSKGRQWSQLTKQLPGRSQNAIKNRANLLLNKDIKKFKSSKRNAQFIKLLDLLKYKLFSPKEQINSSEKSCQNSSEKQINNFTKTSFSKDIINYSFQQNRLNPLQTNLHQNQQKSSKSEIFITQIFQLQGFNIKNSICSTSSHFDSKPIMLTDYMTKLSQQLFPSSLQNYSNLNQLDSQFKKSIEDDLQVFYSE